MPLLFKCFPGKKVRNGWPFHKNFTKTVQHCTQHAEFEKCCTFTISVAKCPPLTPPRNGSFHKCPHDPVYGESCHVTCKIGFKSSQESPLVCIRDNDTGRTRWTQPVPECIRMFCLLQASIIIRNYQK